MVDRRGAVVPTDTWGRLGHSELAIKEKDLEALLGGMCAYQSARGANLWILNTHVTWDS